METGWGIGWANLLECLLCGTVGGLAGRGAENAAGLHFSDLLSLLSYLSALSQHARLSQSNIFPSKIEEESVIGGVDGRYTTHSLPSPSSPPFHASFVQKAAVQQEEE